MTLRLDATPRTLPTQLDVFFAHGRSTDLLEATPSNWGAILLVRTGSREHNVQLCARAEKLGLKLEPQRGLVDADGRVVAGETEEEIFSALGLPWLAPAFREVGVPTPTPSLL
jgi:DNA polymerase (family X)